MIIEKHELKQLINSLVLKFQNFDVISYDYIVDFVNAIINDDKQFDGINIDNLDFKDDMNPQFFIQFKVQNYIYYKLCKLALEDADILLQLVDDKSRVMALICRKLNFEDTSKCEDFIMEAIGLYDASESFDVFLSRYFRTKIKGQDFILKKEENVSNVTTCLDKKAKKKQKKKKRKEKSVVITDIGKKDAEHEVSEEIKEDNSIDESVNKASISEIEEEIDVISYATGLCKNRVGSANVDNFVQLCRMVQLIQKIDIKGNLKYGTYLLLRFGYINNSYYDREEISQMLELNILEVINFERYTLRMVKDIINRKVDKYEEYVLSKKYF